MPENYHTECVNFNHLRTPRSRDLGDNQNDDKKSGRDHHENNDSNEAHRIYDESEEENHRGDDSEEEYYRDDDIIERFLDLHVSMGLVIIYPT